MLSKYQLMISDFYNILIGSVIKLVPNIFNKEKYLLPYEILQFSLWLGLKLKNFIAYQN